MKKINLLIIGTIFVLFSCTKKEDPLTQGKNEEGAFTKQESTDASGSKSSSGSAITDLQLSIKLTPFVPDYPDLGASGRQILSTRINAAVAKVGFGGDGANPRFIIGPDINLLSKNLTGTAPTKYANTYEVTLLSADVVTETIFASYTFTVKGVGDSPDKAFIQGFRDFNFDNEEFYDFLKKTQDKIAQFYESNCNSFLQQADSEAKMRKYDAAYTILNNIPIEAKSCFDQAMNKKAEYFQLSLNTNCQSILASMKAELGKANDPSASGFNEAAMSYYMLIDQQSSCYSEAEKIYQAYLKKLNPKAKRDWEFEMKKYQDQVDRINKLDQFKQDSVVMNFDYLKHKDEMETKAEIEGNKKLLQKYQYDELPWIRKIFHLGKYDPFDRIDK
jgi:hypothetical protein